AGQYWNVIIPDGDREAGCKSGAVQGDGAASHRDACRADRISIQDVRVIGVVGTAVATQVGDADDEAVRAQHLRIDTAHAEGPSVERSRREHWRCCALWIAQGPNAYNRRGLRLGRHPR